MFDVPNSSIIQDELSFIYLAVIKMSLWTFLDNFFFSLSMVIYSPEWRISPFRTLVNLVTFLCIFPTQPILASWGLKWDMTDDYPVSLHGFTRYINSSIMAFLFFLCSVSSQFLMFGLIPNDRDCGLMQMSSNMPGCKPEKA